MTPIEIRQKITHMARQPSNYPCAQKELHWAIALLILIQFVGGDFFTAYFAELTAGSATPVAVLVSAHIVLGIPTLALMIVRLTLRLWLRVPAAPVREDPRLVLVAKLTHGLLYAALFLVPVTGLVGWYGINTFAPLVHTAMTTALGAFVLLHIAVALYHHFILDNNLLARMMPQKILVILAPEKLRSVIR